jgi:Fic family protein
MFIPRFTYTHSIVQNLTAIEAAKNVVDVLPLPPDTTLRLRHEALKRSTLNSTQIEGNPLDEFAVQRAIAQGERRGTQAEQEVRNYWRALDRVEEFAETSNPLDEAFIQELHRIVIVRSRGRRGSRSQYHINECPVVDTVSRRIDYAPPEPKDIPQLMSDLILWLNSPEASEMPAPLRSGILTHRFLSIHPFDDGNGRTGRLVATAELWKSGYRMRGFFSFEEYFNAERDRYYNNLQMNLPVNFYEGRHDPDHTPWLSYFIETLARAARSLQARATQLYEARDIPSVPWDNLPRRNQQVLTRLLSRVLSEMPAPLTIRPTDIEEWLGVSDRTAREWLGEWIENDFLEAVSSGTGTRIREYNLAPQWTNLLKITEVDRENNGSAKEVK